MAPTTTAATTTTTVPPLTQCSATTQTYGANADAWIDQNSPSNNNGSDSILKVLSKSGSDNMRALVRFALPTGIPEGCVVQSATLRLFAASAVGGRTLQALQVTGTWTEGGVTWTSQPATTGPAATTSSGSGYREWNVTAQVQTMFTAGVNNGFLIRDANKNQNHEQQFNSREKGDNLPQLVVTYVQAPAPTTTTTTAPATTSTTTSVATTTTVPSTTTTTVPPTTTTVATDDDDVAAANDHGAANHDDDVAAANDDDHDAWLGGARLSEWLPTRIHQRSCFRQESP